MRFLGKLGMTFNPLGMTANLLGMTATSLGMTAAAVALLALVGCAKVETGGGFSDIPMQFSTYTPRSTSVATKADGSYVAPGTTSLPTSSSFGVFAYLQPGDVWATGGWNSAFMFAQEVSSYDYSYAPTRYWPSSENTISFWAFYPYGAYDAGAGALKFYEDNACTAAYSNASTTGLPVVKYTVATDPAKQQDLMFDSFANTDKTYANCSPTPGTVPLTFQHALSSVEYVIEMPDGAGTVGTDYYFTFNDLTFEKVLPEGVCANPVASPILWTAQGTPVDMTTASYDNTAGKGETFLMMPQTLSDAVKLSIDVLLKMPSSDDPTNRAADLAYSFDNSVQLNTIKDANDNPITKWEPGKRYKYTIKLSLDKIEFSAAVSNWGAESTIDLGQ